METNQIKAMDTNHFSSYSPLQLEGLGEAVGQRTFYVAPAIEIVEPAGERVMFTTSPGVSDNPIDPNGPFDAPKHDLDIEFRDLWEE